MSFYGVTDIWTYVIGAFGIILLPGPNSLYVLSTATARGVRAGYQGACGVFVGDTVLLALTGLGAAGLLKTYPALFAIVKYAGAAYLAWVGLNLIRAAWQGWQRHAAANDGQASEVSVPLPDNPMDEPRAQPPANALWDMNHPFMRALVISLLNPKAILFLLSFFIQFIDKDYPNPIVPFFILSAIIMAFSFIYLSVLILAGAGLAEEFRNRKRLSASLSAAVGGMFIWFAAKLASSSLK